MTRPLLERLSSFVRHKHRDIQYVHMSTDMLWVHTAGVVFLDGLERHWIPTVLLTQQLLRSSSLETEKIEWFGLTFMLWRAALQRCFLDVFSAKASVVLLSTRKRKWRCVVYCGAVAVMPVVGRTLSAATLTASAQKQRLKRLHTLIIHAPQLFCSVCKL